MWASKTVWQDGCRPTPCACCACHTARWPPRKADSGERSWVCACSPPRCCDPGCAPARPRAVAPHAGPALDRLRAGAGLARHAPAAGLRGCLEPGGRRVARRNRLGRRVPDRGGPLHRARRSARRPCDRRGLRYGCLGRRDGPLGGWGYLDSARQPAPGIGRAACLQPPNDRIAPARDARVTTKRPGNLRELAVETRMNSASIFDLSPSEKLQLVEDLWDDLAAAPEAVPVYDWQKQELARRKANLLRNPASELPWEEVKRMVRARYAR